MNNLFLDMELREANYQRHLARVDLFEETIFLTKYRDGGTVEACEVSPEDLAAAFSRVPVTTGLLPRRALFYTRHQGRELLGVFLPPETRRLTQVAGGETKVFEVPMPPLVFVGHSEAYRIFAVKQYPGERERLFHAPCPNVNDAGRICAGDAEFPPCTSKTIHEAARVFFTSRFNDHLVDGKSTAHPDDIVQAWSSLDEAKPARYPIDDLVKTRWCLADVMKGVHLA